MGLRNEEVCKLFVGHGVASGAISEPATNGNESLKVKDRVIYSYKYRLAWHGGITNHTEGLVYVNLAFTGQRGQDQSGKRSWDLAYSPSTQRHRSQVRAALRKAGYMPVFGRTTEEHEVWTRDHA
jgi:hypothetical protein